MTAPFLSIITRCYKRPTMLARLKASLAAQTCQDFEHLLIVDDVGIGVAEANRRLADVQFKGRYAYILDDDDELTDPKFIANLKTIARWVRPDVIMVRSDNGELGILPDASVWGGKAHEGHIDMLDFVVSALVYYEHAADFDGGYAGDFSFINAVLKDNYRVYWHDRVVARIQRRSWGAPE